MLKQFISVVQSANRSVKPLNGQCIYSRGLNGNFGTDLKSHSNEVLKKPKYEILQPYTFQKCYKDNLFSFVAKIDCHPGLAEVKITFGPVDKSILGKMNDSEFRLFLRMPFTVDVNVIGKEPYVTTSNFLIDEEKPYNLFAISLSKNSGLLQIKRMFHRMFDDEIGFLQRNFREFESYMDYHNAIGSKHSGRVFKSIKEKMDDFNNNSPRRMDLEDLLKKLEEHCKHRLN